MSVYTISDADQGMQLLFSASSTAGASLATPNTANPADPRHQAVQFVCGSRAHPVDGARVLDKLRRGTQLPSACGTLHITVNDGMEVSSPLSPASMVASTALPPDETEPLALFDATALVPTALNRCGTVLRFRFYFTADHNRTGCTIRDYSHGSAITLTHTVRSQQL